jgi:MSHA pilin protein MshA
MTMLKRKLCKNEEGFTLIEIIAVIIIMGILAAVAVPKFFSMQEDAKRAALNGALSEAAARFNHAYARYILDLKRAPSNVENVLDTSDYLGTAALTGQDIGDFEIKWEKDGAGNLIITVVSMETIDDTTLSNMLIEDKTKTVTGVNWGS